MADLASCATICCGLGAESLDNNIPLRPQDYKSLRYNHLWMNTESG